MTRNQPNEDLKEEFKQKEQMCKYEKAGKERPKIQKIMEQNIPKQQLVVGGKITCYVHFLIYT